MRTPHDQMKAALKTAVVPHLRERGFSGSFPHFRRCGSSGIDLLTFQFDRWGGGFVIEIGKCPVEGITTYWGKEIAPGKVTAWDLHPNKRVRIQPVPGSGPEEWFRYDSATTEDDFDRVAESVMICLEKAD